MPIRDLEIEDIGKLRVDATGFANSATEFKTTTDQMLAAVNNSLADGYMGEASTAFITKFNGLKDEMDIIYKECEEYSNDLMQIADNFEQGEAVALKIATSVNEDLGIV